MRTGRIVLILTATAIFTLLITPCFSQAKAEKPVSHGKNIKSEPRPIRPEMTKEMIDRFIEQTAKTDSSRAKELEQLRKDNPQKLEKIIHEHFAKRADAPKDRKARYAERAQKRQEQHIEWLKENYPNDVNELMELKEKKSKLYSEKISLSMRRYRRIKDAQDDNNTELADVLKKEMELNKEKYDLLRDIKSTKREKKKQELIDELKDVLSQKYDIIVQRKQMAYEKLLEKLDELKTQVKESKNGVQQWKDAEFKEKNIDARLKEMLGKDEKFHWED